MKAREMMNACFVEVAPTDTVLLAACLMWDERAGLVCVCDEDQRPVGVVTDRDLATRVCAAERPVRLTAVQEIMSSQPRTCGLDASVSEIEGIMADKGVTRVLVVDDHGRLAGVVSLAEIWHYESPLTAGQVSRRVTQRQLRLQTSRARRPTSLAPQGQPNN